MRHASRGLLACAIVLLACAAATARADDVVLDNGKTLVGRVVSEDDRAVKLETDIGTMTIDRSRVREIRRKPVPPKAKPPETPAGPKPGGPTAGGAASGGIAGGSDPCDDRAPYVPTPLPALLAQMEAIHLATWKEPVPEVFAAPPSVRGSWRIERADGRVSTERDSPHAEAGVAKVWYLHRIVEPAADGKPGRAEWTRMSWRPIGHIWIEGPPERAAYVDDEQIAREIVTRFVRTSSNGWKLANATAALMQGIRLIARHDGTTPNLAGKPEELLAAVTAATNSRETAVVIARVLEIEAEAMDATPDGKVRMATERRALLRDLVKSAK